MGGIGGSREQSENLQIFGERHFRQESVDFFDTLNQPVVGQTDLKTVLIIIFKLRRVIECRHLFVEPENQNAYAYLIPGGCKAGNDMDGIGGDY